MRFLAALPLPLLLVGLAAAPAMAAPPIAAIGAHDALAAIDLHRGAIVGDIVGAHARGDAETLKQRLLALRADHLLAASLASSREALLEILDPGAGSARAARDSIAKFTPGPPPPPPDRLVYHPLTPCRLVDTRGFGAPIQGGAFSPNQRRSYAPTGECAIPATGVYSLVVSFTTQNLTPMSGGYLALLRPSAAVSTTVDIFNLGSEWSAASTLVATGTAGEFDAFVSAANAHLVIDVLGFYKAVSVVTGDIADGAITAAKLATGSLPAGASPQFLFANTTIPVGQTVIAYPPFCPTGTQAISGTCNPGSTGAVLVGTGWSVNQYTCRFKNDTGSPADVSAGVVCLGPYAAQK